MRTLIRPVSIDGYDCFLKTKSIHIMGKAGTTVGQKGDIMIPTNFCQILTNDMHEINNCLKINDVTPFLEKKDQIKI